VSKIKKVSIIINVCQVFLYMIKPFYISLTSAVDDDSDPLWLGSGKKVDGQLLEGID
jgi:hypothetical protein